MAHFLKGKYKGYYPTGTSECVRDIFRFRELMGTRSETTLTLE
jgi:hypothetical protein